MTSYVDHLRPFLPYVPPQLVSAECLDRILSVAQRLPAALGIGPFMLECTLDHRPVADFSVAAFASRGDHAALARPGSTNIAAASNDDAAWTRVREFARLWGDATSPMSAAIDEVWLEFDVCLTRDTPDTSPNVFFSVGCQSPPDGAARGALMDRLVSVATQALHALEGRPLSAARLAALTECFLTLPQGSRILFLGALTPRGSAAIRVVASGLSVHAMRRHLQRLGVRQPFAHLPLMADILDITERHWLAIDVDATGVRDRIGLDLYCTETTSAARGGPWERLLDRFVVHGVCTPHKRQALLDATDMSTAHLDDPAWPASLRMASTIFGPAGLDMLRTSIHHIKVITQPGAPLEAKAYLCGSYNSRAPQSGANAGHEARFDP